MSFQWITVSSVRLFCFGAGDPMNLADLTRRLSAILSADVEGYSRLMRDDEVETVRTITAYRAVVAHMIEQYRGRFGPGAPKPDSAGPNVEKS